jgi:hypothetical protein
LYGCETWSLTLREELIEVFENRVLRRIFRTKREEVVGVWGNPHNEELQNLYSSPSTIRMIKPRNIRWAGHVECMGAKWNAYTVWVGKSEGKRPL